MNKNIENLIIGFGNTLLSDEGIGVHIIKKLKKESNILNSLFLDLGTSSLDVSYYINDKVKKVIIIDSIKVKNHAAGSIFLLDLKDLKKNKRHLFSLHQLELTDSLNLLSINHKLPTIKIIGIVPSDIETFSESLSEKINSGFPEIYDSILKIIIDLIK